MTKLDRRLADVQDQSELVTFDADVQRNWPPSKSTPVPFPVVGINNLPFGQPSVMIGLLCQSRPVIVLVLAKSWNCHRLLRHCLIDYLIWKVCFAFLSSWSLISGSPCDRLFRSDVEKNGTFTSPSYPSSYAASMNCNYEFRGHGRERVQIIFTDFVLHHPHDDPSESVFYHSFCTLLLTIYWSVFHFYWHRKPHHPWLRHR